MAEKKAEIIELPSSLEIRDAGEFLATIKCGLESGDNLTINASEVDRITTPCIQIIMSAIKTLDAKGGSCTIKSPSKPFLQAFEDLGAAELVEKYVS